MYYAPVSNQTHMGIVEAEAAARFVEPDVRSLVEIDALRDGETGLVDLEKVHAEFDRLAEDRPHWVKPPAEPEPGARAPVPDDRPGAAPEPRTAGTAVRRPAEERGPRTALMAALPDAMCANCGCAFEKVGRQLYCNLPDCLCSADGCKRPRKSMRWCHTHYQRFHPPRRR